MKNNHLNVWDSKGQYFDNIRLNQYVPETLGLPSTFRFLLWTCICLALYTMLVMSKASPTAHRTPVAIRPVLAPKGCKQVLYFCSHSIESKICILTMEICVIYFIY